MIRMGQHYARIVAALVGIGLAGAITYFIVNDLGYSWIAPSVHIALGSLFAALCFQARKLLRASWAERVLWGAVALLSLQFFAQSIIAAQLSSTITEPSALIRSPYWQGVMMSGAFAGVFAGLVILVVTTFDVINELQAERDIDPLTGLFNRRGLERCAQQRLNQVNRQQYAVIIGDIDHFKSVNDELGHAVGDHVLSEFADILRLNASTGNILARIGGEEFILLVQADAEEAEKLAKNLCQKVARHSFAMLPGARRMTCSFGVAMVREDDSLWDTTQRADIALMQVKRRGRNRVAVEGDEFQRSAYADYLLTA